MIKSILLACDGSDYSLSARNHAMHLAGIYGARLLALYVIDVRLLQRPVLADYSYPLDAVPASELPMQILNGFRRGAEQLLEAVRESAEAAGLEVELRMEEGVPSQVIAEAGDSHDLIVLGKRGEHSRWGRDLLGSTTENVVRRAKSPVLLAERQAQSVRACLLLYDGSHPANQALKLAADIATHADATLRIFTAGQDLEEAAEIQEAARSYLGAFDIPVTYRIRVGDVIAGLAEELDEEDADLVFLGMQGHSLLHNLILGSTTEQLMRELPKPLLLAP